MNTVERVKWDIENNDVYDRWMNAEYPFDFIATDIEVKAEDSRAVPSYINRPHYRGCVSMFAEWIINKNLENLPEFEEEELEYLNNFHCQHSDLYNDSPEESSELIFRAREAIGEHFEKR